ncbi:MAG: histidine phosphatase family protein [Bradyrhizobium sp.]|nr:MAG: histidine phosphatase family protein [Bradyrhizobium sp.]
MRRLLLLRHAKAVVATGRNDFERDLVERGRRDAARIGAYVAHAGLIPDLLLHSGAARTRQTAEAVLACWARKIETRVEPGLYEATRAAALAIAAALPERCASAMLVGHNPSIGDLANALTDTGAQVELMAMAARFPTAGLAVLEFDVVRWRDIAVRSAKLLSFVTPEDPRLKAG